MKSSSSVRFLKSSKQQHKQKLKTIQSSDSFIVRGRGKLINMNLRQLCFIIIFVYISSIPTITSSSSSSSQEYEAIHEYERRRHSDDYYKIRPQNYEYESTEIRNGLDHANGLPDTDDYDTLDVIREESYREPRIELENRHRHIPTKPPTTQKETVDEGVRDRSEPPSHRQIETHINYNTVPGTPGVDYPSHAYVPLTTFYCYNHQHPGYYADVEAGCQVFHVCDVDGRQDSFLCPKGTIFNQAYFICDWWFNVDCGQAPKYYNANADLHKDRSSATSDTEASYSDSVRHR